MTALPSSILPGSPQFWEAPCMFFQVNDRSITQDMCPHRPLGTLAHKWSAGRVWPINSSTWAQQTSHFFSLVVHPSRVYPSQDTVIMLHQATLNSSSVLYPPSNCTSVQVTELQKTMPSLTLAVIADEPGIISSPVSMPDHGEKPAARHEKWEERCNPANHNPYSYHGDDAYHVLTHTRSFGIFYQWWG